MQQPGAPPPGGYNPGMRPGMQPAGYIGGGMPMNSGPLKPGQAQGMGPPGTNPVGMYGPAPVTGAPPTVSGAPPPIGQQYAGQRLPGQSIGRGQYPGDVQRTGQPGGMMPPLSSNSMNSHPYGTGPPAMRGPPPGPQGPPPATVGHSFNSGMGPPPSSSGVPPSASSQVGPPPPSSAGGGFSKPSNSGPSSRYPLAAQNRFAPGSAATNSYANGGGINDPSSSSSFMSQRLPNTNLVSPSGGASPRGSIPPPGGQSPRQGPPGAGPRPMGAPQMGPPPPTGPPVIGSVQQDSRPGSVGIGAGDTSLNSSATPQSLTPGFGPGLAPPSIHKSPSTSSLGSLPRPRVEIMSPSPTLEMLNTPSPSGSGPPSARSSAAPSPIPSQQYDSLEGGVPYFPNSQGPPPAGEFPQHGQFGHPNTYTGPPSHASGQYLGPPPPGGHAPPAVSGPPPTGPPPMGGPPMGGPRMGGPPMGGPPTGPPTGPPMGPPTGPPTGQDISRAGGMTGRRQYPQQPGYMGTAPPQPNSGMAQPPTGMAPQPGSFQPSQVGSRGGPMNEVPNDAMKKESTTMNDINAGMNNLRLQETRPFNLLQERHIVQAKEFKPPKAKLHPDYQKLQVSPDVFRCTLNAIPESQSLLQKSRLPFGLIIHPFRDLSHLPVIQSSVIVRCRSCRTYINPFVAFIDNRRWRCNLCFRVNDLPEEFTFDPVTKTYGEPQRRPEIKSSTIEFIAPSEYMLRPPQPAVYLFLLDVSFSAVESGYLSVICQTLLEYMEKMPGDARTMIGFITFDSTLHFYSLPEGATRPQMMVVSDVDDVFLPCPSDLLVNVHESKELICELLNQLPAMFVDNKNTQTALGPALQAALKLMSATGGRVTIFQCTLPSVGVGALKSREDPNQRATAKSVPNLGPATDFYKRTALEYSGHQVAADLFVLGAQYMDIATLAGIAKFSGGCLNHYPAFHTIQNPIQAERLESDFRRYLTRKIGFEAVMRIRCTKGMSIHAFHGNFFVRSTDLLSLPNINPDAGFAMQVAIEDNLNSSSMACFQAALLYTSSKGERRIRVHTMCLPVANQLTDVIVSADAQAITGLLSRMAVDKCQTSNLGDARDALVNVCLDTLAAYRTTLASSHAMGALMCPPNLRLLPLYTLSLLKNMAFRLGTSTKLDSRVFAMEMFKCMPLFYIMLHVHPNLYPVHNLSDEGGLLINDQAIPQPGLIGLSSEYLSRDGAFLMDCGDAMYLFVGQTISPEFCQDVLDVPNFASIPEGMMELPELDNPTSDRMRTFISWLLEKRPYHAPLLVIRDDSKHRGLFLRNLIQDRTEGSMSYYEFIQHLQKEVK
ncbi:protein transport protein Sec24A-like isoform X1 [Diadema antillarum]|uniref:protein transport protein Sec24A-like isoform X1 n=1 Tax=Diadema antillarum TaxID=105358 RepID=UPI003A898852